VLFHAAWPRYEWRQVDLTSPLLRRTAPMWSRFDRWTGYLDLWKVTPNGVFQRQASSYNSPTGIFTVDDIERIER
jgi:hypothetical protein